jgi:hypothetical protein
MPVAGSAKPIWPPAPGQPEAVGAVGRVHRGVRKAAGHEEDLLDGHVLLPVGRELGDVVGHRARDVERRSVHVVAHGISSVGIRTRAFPATASVRIPRGPLVGVMYDP